MAAGIGRLDAAGLLRVLLFNSAGVWRKLKRAFSLKFLDYERLTIKGERTSRSARVHLENRVAVVARSVNLQGSHGMSHDFRQRLAPRVQKLASPAEAR